MASGSIDGRVKLTGFTIPASMSSSFSIADNTSYRIGKLVVINLRIAVSSQQSVSGTYILGGLPKGETTLANESAFAVAIVRNGTSTYAGGIANVGTSASILMASGTSPFAANSNTWIHAVYFAA